MIEFENYKTNLDIRDKYDFKDIKVSSATVYTGTTERIFEKQEETERTSPLLAAAIIGLDNTAIPIPKQSKFMNIWTDHDAQEVFLDTKPTCYVIFGKSGAGAFKLGEALSKRLNCIHLCPKNMISDELEQRSPTGRALDFNMKHNIPCNFDIMLKILKTKVQSPTVQHRGYVISGIPLVPSRKDKLFFIKSLTGEESFLIAEELLFDIICNLKKKKPVKSVSSPKTSESSQLSGLDEEEREDVEDEKDVAEEAVEEEEVAPAVLPTFELKFCSDVLEHRKGYYKTTQTTLLNQIEELFNLSLTPDIIIHVSCPDLDIVTVKRHQYLNFKTGQVNIKPFNFNYVSDFTRPHKIVISDYKSSDPPPPDFNPKYNCLLPSHFKERCLDEICNYQDMVFPFMHKKIKDINPRKFIEIDGRAGLPKMLHNVMERLILLHIQPVLIPEPLYLQEPVEDIEEFWKSVSDFKTITSGVLNFKRTPSHWYNRCPVELKLRRSVVGNPKYAMAFFKHVYVLSSLDNFVSFYQNPRPYLKLKYLEPTCRVIITGTKSSGKSMIAECLSWIFDCPITNFKYLIEKEKEKKYEIFARSILSEIIATIEDARYRDWEKIESNRVAKLNAWSKQVLKLLNEYCALVNSLKQQKIERNTVEKRRKIKKVVEKGQLPEQKDKKLLDVEENQLPEQEVNQLLEEEEKQPIEEEEKQLREEEEKQVPEEEEKQVLVLVEEKELEYSDEEEYPKIVFSPNDQLKINALRQKLSFLPMLDNLEECETAISNNLFLEYAPAELSTVSKKPAIPTLGDEDVTIAISNYIISNDLEKEIEPTSDEVMSELVRHIYTIDANHEQETEGNELYGKYIIDGLPSDPEYWSHLNNPILTPDHTIALMENKEVDQELMQYYINVEKCTKYYADKILAANDPLIETKLVSEKSKPTVIGVIENLSDYCINRALNVIVSSENEEVPDSIITSFSESIDKFRENWDSLKLMLEEKSKSYIEVELENKTDVEIVEEVLLKLRNSYTFMPSPSEEEGVENTDDDTDGTSNTGATKDLLTYNDPKFYCETYFYSPVTFFLCDTLWHGNPLFSLLYNNKVYNFANEEYLEKFRRDKSRFMHYNKPFKVFPKIKVCITGSIGCGATVLAKKIAKELGLLYINFADIINFYMKPRHFKNVGRKYENIFVDENLDDDGVVDFQMAVEGENETGDILTDETEMRRMIQFYFDRGTPLVSVLTQKMIKKIWFNPFVPAGFVLDGYPRMPSDFEDMLSASCIPDIVIDLESNSEVAIKRMASGMFNQWKNHQLEAKEKAKTKLYQEREEWSNRICKKLVIKLIIEGIFDNMFFSPDDKAGRLSTESTIIDSHPSGSSNVDPLLFNAYNELIQEDPEPIDTNEWEKNDEARERIESRIQILFETDDENIQAMKELMREQRIKMVTLDGTKPEYKVFKECLSNLMFLKHRNRSLLEQTFIVSLETAKWLLENGFCFFSKFNRICPIHIHLYPNSVQNSYKIARRKGTLFPVVHRAYIYFICKPEYVKIFRRNPLKFIISKAIESYREYPLRLSVIGLPKSGVSTLVAKLAKDNCLISISKGSAIRMILENMPWTQQASRLRALLQAGELLDDDVIVDAIQTVAIDHRTVTYGFIYDGIPETSYCAKALVKLGLYPNVIIDLNVTKDKVVDNALNEVNYDVLKYRPPFPKPLIEKRYDNWRMQNFKIRDWIADDYQNLTLIDANQSKWKVFKDVDGCINKVAKKIHFYLIHVDKTIVRAMWVSNESFSEKQSSYRNLCPVCFSEKVYRHSDYPPDKKGVVEYKNTFYWICEEHIESVMMFPHVYLAPQDIEVPELPAVVKSIKTQYLYEKGTCIVTYAEHLPAQKLVAGSLDYACRYHQKAYLFCSKECLTKFLAKPQLYYDIKVFRESKNFKKLSLKNLPYLGYLEQTIGNVLTDACCSVNVFRPKYPGLSFPISAIIFIALNFKVHNPLVDDDKKALYHKALVVFEARCKMLERVGLILRSMNNPFTLYPICHHAKPTLHPGEIEELCSVTIQSPHVRKSSSYVQKRKPSFFRTFRRSTVSGAMVRP